MLGDASPARIWASSRIPSSAQSGCKRSLGAYSARSCGMTPSASGIQIGAAAAARHLDIHLTRCGQFIASTLTAKSTARSTSREDHRRDLRCRQLQLKDICRHRCHLLTEPIGAQLRDSGAQITSTLVSSAAHVIAPSESMLVPRARKELSSGTTF